MFFWLANSAKAAIRYEVSLAHPEQHLFHVTMQIPDVTGDVTVQMPAWNALYQIRDFSAHVQQVEAFVGADQAPIEKLDKQNWHIHGKGTVTIRYATYWDEGGPFATQLNTEHAFINPAMILLYAPDRRSEIVQLTMEDVPERWEAAGASLTTMEAIGESAVFCLMHKGTMPWRMRLLRREDSRNFRFRKSAHLSGWWCMVMGGRENNSKRNCGGFVRTS
jgi:hypothetical protein